VIDGRPDRLVNTLALYLAMGGSACLRHGSVVGTMRHPPSPRFFRARIQVSHLTTIHAVEYTGTVVIQRMEHEMIGKIPSMPPGKGPEAVLSTPEGRQRNRQPPAAWATLPAFVSAPGRCILVSMT